MAITRFQRLTINFSGRVRQATYRGKVYLVAPMTLINPGVLSGSKGPLLYPPEEIARNARQWNGVPITIYHPHALGQPVSARHPGILDRQGVGVVRNATANGKLRAEGWFDAERLRRVNPGVYDRLTKGEPVELSTGLYTENEETSGTFYGRSYTAIARNYRADHLAVLPDQIGACSIADGCGVLVNRRHSMSLQTKLRVLVNANPQGRNQYTGGAGGGAGIHTTSEIAHRSSQKANKHSSSLHDLSTSDDVYKASQAHKTAANAHSVAAEHVRPFSSAVADKHLAMALKHRAEIDRMRPRPVENESAEQKDSEEEDTVRLKTDRPTPKDPKNADEAAGVHDKFPKIAESPLDDDDLEATEIFGDDWQDHLDDAEEENKDTEVKFNSLSHKLAGLVGNWDGPPKSDDDEDDDGGDWPDDEDSDADVDDLGAGGDDEDPGGQQQQAGPPQAPAPPAPPAAPQVPPTVIQPPDPNVWLQKQIGMLIAKYMEIQGATAGPPAAAPPQQPPQQQMPGPPLGNQLRRKMDFLVRA
jgi:hypothetical protein